MAAKDRQSGINYVKSLCGKAAGESKGRMKFVGEFPKLIELIKEKLQN